EEKILTINIRAGIRVGARIRFPGEGNVRPGTMPADIVFVIRNENFGQHNNNRGNNRNTRRKRNRNRKKDPEAIGHSANPPGGSQQNLHQPSTSGSREVNSNKFRNQNRHNNSRNMDIYRLKTMNEFSN